MVAHRLWSRGAAAASFRPARLQLRRKRRGDAVTPGLQRTRSVTSLAGLQAPVLERSLFLMKAFRLSEHLAAGLLSRPRASGGRMPVVLISRGTMSGGEALSQCLAERLSLHYVCREDLIEVIDAQGEHAKKVRASLDRATRAYDQFGQLRRPYLVLMRRALLGFIREGDVVYAGYASHLLVPNLPCCLRVRINAPMPARVRNAVRRLSLPESEAREAVLREDEQRVRWGRFMYGRDIRDPDLYDVCFSLDRISLDAICSMIAAGLREKEFQRGPEAANALEELFLSASVEAALVSDPRTLGWEIGARARERNVLLEGPFLEERQLSDVLEVARAVEGVRAVEYQPGCASSFDV
jgi:Cytidylate kinase-like family